MFHIFRTLCLRTVWLTCHKTLKSLTIQNLWVHLSIRVVSPLQPKMEIIIIEVASRDQMMVPRPQFPRNGMLFCLYSSTYLLGSSWLTSISFLLPIACGCKWFYHHHPPMKRHHKWGTRVGLRVPSNDFGSGHRCTWLTVHMLKFYSRFLLFIRFIYSIFTFIQFTGVCSFHIFIINFHYIFSVSVFRRFLFFWTYCGYFHLFGANVLSNHQS